MSAAAEGGADPVPDVTVLFLGNPLLGDDGLGEHAMEALQRDFEASESVAIVPGGNAGLDLLPVVEDARRLIVVDAIDAAAPAGSLVVLEEDAIPVALGRALSPHQVGIAQVLALADVRGHRPERVVAMGLQPGPLREGIGLSEPVCAGLPELGRALVARLRDWGVPLHPRAGCETDRRPAPAPA